jgi:hypothetical protein
MGISVLRTGVWHLFGHGTCLARQSNAAFHDDLGIILEKQSCDAEACSMFKCRYFGPTPPIIVRTNHLDRTNGHLQEIDELVLWPRLEFKCRHD